MGGILGRLFHEFAVTIGAAILVSGFVSLSLTPLLSAEFLRPHANEQHGAAVQGHRALLRRDARTSTSAACAACCAIALHDADASRSSCSPATVWLFIACPKGFIPSEDTGPDLRISLEAAQGISFDAMVAPPACRSPDIVAADPNVDAFFSTSAAAAAAANTGVISLRLKPRSAAQADRGRGDRASCVRS